MVAAVFYLPIQKTELTYTPVLLTAHSSLSWCDLVRIDA
jgi:hypothetical protein